MINFIPHSLNKKQRIRLTIFSVLCILSYLICTLSLFFTDHLFIPIISFIALFLSIYFIVFDIYKYNMVRWFLMIFGGFIVETILFIIFLWFSWYLVLELLLFHATIWSLYLMLYRYLDNRVTFSPFSYFTGWGFLVTTLLTIFFCVFMMWKYTQIPFSCDDIEWFPSRVVDTTVNPVKKVRNNIVWWFKQDEKEQLEKPTFYALDWWLKWSEAKASADKVEEFFVNTRNMIQTETLDVKWEIWKATCEYYLKTLQKIQQSEGIQIAAIILSYFLLVWVFKIILWIVTIIWFLLFLILRICWVYKFETQPTERKMIV